MILSSKRLTNANSVLAADDDLDNLRLINYVLDAINVRCYGVDDSRSVLDLATDIAPKLILLDIIMPKLSGFEVLKQLKSNIVTRYIPVIAVTGLATPCQQAKIRRAGFDDYICKPFMLEELESKIAEHLNCTLVKFAA